MEKHEMGHGIYVGPEMALKSETALLRWSDVPGCILAQFDRILLVFDGKELHLNWHEFAEDDFVLDKKLS